MNNEMLFSRIKRLVTIERRIGVEILECLYEIDRRKAYAELKYDGLYTYCVKELGFTDSQAYQRIQAMRAVKDTPELKPMIESGALSVPSVSKVQAHFRNERKSGVTRTETEKMELYESVKHCSSREVEVVLAAERGEALKRRVVLELDDELFQMWVKAKGMSAHTSGGDEVEVLRILLKTFIEKREASLMVSERQRAVPLSTRVAKLKYVETLSRDVVSRPAVLKSTLVPRRKAIPVGVRRAVWLRDKSKCTECNSKFAIELDHIKPWALSGENTCENLRLLCRSCNRHAAIRVFGVEKMEKYSK